MDHIFQANYQKQQPHPLKDRTGDDYVQIFPGNIPQMSYASNDITVGSLISQTE
ncbi:hypothetical protein H6G97_44570 [Nostoc flagelliforme FACHB-838]|uniref:Uncharacterized protein n=1 Tax=Nostoc flagelliforme FACHB-838 TaxID=2692904 RepID=A0ABR8E682_9NOSO|nr:hypothetical protein [Nostoc flagelliforme]MBD2536025.1 hypothetical protein [Nostoc flagelliforme FACHB-838]